MRFNKIRILLAVLSIISLFTLSSCTKNSTSNKDDNANNEKTAVSDSDFNETNEDLLTVDYKQFYDELAPHGDWVQVSAKDLGIDLKKGEDAGKKSSFMKELLGIKDAYADDVNFGMFFVWRPSPELAVAVSTVEPAPVYVPYTRGQWIYTDAGWYFRAPTPYEEITVHYGRWVFSPDIGWVWVPGRVWAPAWVQWYEDDNYIGWAPLPPSTYIIDYGVPPVVIENDRFVFVERNYFVEPDVYRHCYLYSDNPDRFSINQMTRIDGVMIQNNVVINKGPQIEKIEQITGKKIDVVKVNKVDKIRNAKYSGGELNSYSPHFTKVKGADRKESVTKPNNFVSFDHAESKHKSEMTQKNAGSNDNNKASRDYGSTKDKKGNKERLNNDNKQSDKQMSKGNNNNNYKQKDNNSNQEKFRRKTNDNKGSQRKEYKPKGNDKGYQQPKGNDKGYQQPKGNDKGSHQKQSNGNTHDNNGQNNNYGSGNERGSNQTQGNGQGRGKH